MTGERKTLSFRFVCNRPVQLRRQGSVNLDVVDVVLLQVHDFVMRLGNTEEIHNEAHLDRNWALRNSIGDQSRKG